MGNKPEKGAKLPTPLIVKRLSECLVPDEKETILDYFEMLDIKMTKKGEELKHRKQFRENRGAFITLKIVRKMIDGTRCYTLNYLIWIIM